MEILLVGDVMIGRLINDLLKNERPAYIWGDTLPIFNQADLRVINLECVISDQGHPWDTTPKAFHFQSDAKNVAALKAAGINIVSLANNHTLDFQVEAMIDMLGILKSNDIGTSGAGRDLSEAKAPVFRKIDDLKVGFIAFSDNEPLWEANKNPGIYYLPVDINDKRAMDLSTLITKISRNVDFLIASIHWGPNWGYRPSPNHIPFARALVDAGVDLIFGHSCHVTQGIEIYRSAVIIYSAGDFIDDYAVDPVERNDRSFIFMVEADRHRVNRLKLYPTVIRDFQARLATGEERDQIAATMHNLCRDFNTDSTWNEPERYLEIAIKKPPLRSKS